tara:strand:+ start:316 stop:882 length:567 start_codon:yes stop_codon:yes gene_type:complete
MKNMYNSRISLLVLARESLFVVLGVGLMALMSQISIPLKPVPITFQTVGFLIIGLTYTPRQAFLSFGAYLFSGALGAPVFTHFSSGPAVLMGPTAGYLAGFLVIGAAMAWVRQTWDLKRPFSLFLLCLVAQICLYSMGISWLSISMPLETAFAVGVVPFILPGIAKALITAGILGYLKKPVSPGTHAD